MYPLGKRKFAWIHAIISLVVFLSSVLVPFAPALAELVQITPGIVNETSNLPQDQLGYYEFRDITKSFTYSSGSVCISGSSTSCDPVQVDDGIKVWVNGQSVGDFLSRTQPVGPIMIPSDKLISGNNSIRVVLYDVQGPYRGSSPIYLVTGSQSSPWFNSCSIVPGGISFPEAAIKQGDKVWRFVATYQLCEDFAVLFQPNVLDEGYELNVEWNASGGHYSFSTDRFGNVEYSPNLPFSRSPITPPYFRGPESPDYWFEWGFKHDSSLGTESIGVKGETTQYVGHLVREPKKPAAPQYATDPLLNQDEVARIIFTYGAAGVIATILSNALSRANALFFMANIEEWYCDVSVTGCDSSTPTAASVNSASAMTPSAVSEETTEAVRQRIGDLVEFTSLNQATVRDRMSAYTAFPYEASGFTPNSPVYVTYGPPNADFMFLHLIKSDGNGTIRGNMEMPVPAEVPLGQYLFLALDYQSMRTSIENIFADPENGTMSVYGAAKLIEVVQDVTPPATTAFATGPLDVNNMFRDTVTISFVAEDDLSGVDHVEYSRDEGATWVSIPPEGTFTIDGSGIHHFLYRSVDKVGNVEQSQDSGPIMISKYLAFAGASGTTSLTIYGNTGTFMTGDMHGNGNVFSKYNTNVHLNGSISRVGSFQQVGDWNTTLQSVQGSSQQMLAYPISKYEQMADVVYPSSVTINNTGKSLSGVHFVKGNLSLKSTSLAGDVVFVATGSIYDWSTGSSIVSSDPDNGIVMFAGGNITSYSTDQSVVGMYYAPNGTVKFDGSTGLQFNGSVVGKYVMLKYLTNSSLSYNAGFDSKTYQLPLVSLVGAAATATEFEPFVEEDQHLLFLPIIQQ